MIASIRGLARFPRNIWILLVTQPLAMTSAPLLIMISGILATQIAPDPRLATLPIAFLVVGTACCTIPAAMLMQRIGRKRGTYLGLSLLLAGALSGMLSAVQAQFSLLLLCSFLTGAGMSFVQQLRFAAIESLDDPQDSGTALSLLMLGGVIAAYLGPEAAVYGKDLLSSPHGFAGSFALLAGMTLMSMLLFSQFQEPEVQSTDQQSGGRPILTIARTPVYLVALLAAAMGYGVMSFLMTATPISMHEVHGHSLEATKWVIQSHIMAMFLPSLVTGLLIRKFGVLRLLVAGCVAYLLVLVFALQGHEQLHYWWALILLGVGWNFLFIGGTTLLPQGYQSQERYKAQAFNDFCVFAGQTLASLSAGWLLFQFGWSTLNWLCLIPVSLMLIVLAVYQLHWQTAGKIQGPCGP